MGDEWAFYVDNLFWKKLQKPSSIVKNDWKYLSCHPFLKKEMILRVPYGDWDWRSMSRREQQWKLDLIVAYPHRRWDWNYLSSVLPLSFIRKHPDLPWDFKSLCKRIITPIPSLSSRWEHLSATAPVEFIFSHAHLPWRWGLVSKNKSLSMTDVCNYPLFTWDFPYLMTHSFFTMDDLKRSSILYNYKLLSENPFLRPHVVKAALFKNWDWVRLAIHPAFPPQHVYNDSTLASRWRWDRCLQNPRISFNFFLSLRKEILIPNQFSELCQNHFQMASSLLLYQKSVLVRFLWSCILKIRFSFKLKVLSHLKKYLCPNTMKNVLDFV